MKKYKVKLSTDTEESVTIGADYFEIDDSGNIIFYKEEENGKRNTVFVVQRNYYMYVKQIEE